ncbi:MAG TPA: DUF11 domain-containing protein [Vicinamibacteria bacterium]|nr:DUF11 domain-containing protein [Vicinamibacteria bacterium]
MKELFRFFNLLIATILVLSFAPTGWASLPPGPILNPAGTQWYVRGAHNTALNQYLVVFSDLGGVPDVINGVRLDATGAQIAPGLFTISDVDSNTITPDVAYNSTRNVYLVVWTDAETGGGDIYGQFLNASGARIGPTEFFIAGGAGDQTLPRIAYNPTDDLFMVTWGRRGGAVNAHIGVQMVDGDPNAASNLVGGGLTFDLSSNPLVPHSPHVDWNPISQRFLVVWTGFVNESSSDVRIRYFDGQGIPISNVLSIRSNGQRPSVAANSQTGDFLIAYETGQPGINFNVRAQIWDGSGSALVPEFNIATQGNPIPEWRPHAAYNHLADRYFVTYAKGRGCGFPCDDVLGNTITPTGIVGAVVGVADDNILQDHGSDDGFGSWGDLVASSTQPHFLELYQRGNDGINGGILTLAGVAAADLSLTKNDGVEFVEPGDNVTYTLVATNAGPSPVSGATVTDNFPTDLTGCSWSCSASGGASCTAGPVNGNLLDTIDLPVGSLATYTATCTFTGSESDEITNTATISAPMGVAELNPANNSASDTDTVLGVFGTCGFANHLLLSDSVLNSVQTITACQTLTLGTNVQIMAPAGLTLRAGESVIFDNGSSAGNGATLTAEIDPTLANP